MGSAYENALLRNFESWIKRSGEQVWIQRHVSKFIRDDQQEALPSSAVSQHRCRNQTEVSHRVRHNEVRLFMVWTTELLRRSKITHQRRELPNHISR